MSYTLIFTDSYKKRAKRFARQHPELKEHYRKTPLLLGQNPYHPSLRQHPLKG
jgi:mRNA-degrading endonuclease YafQ of YafQ-DinJ toxin-antitoxin module